MTDALAPSVPPFDYARAFARNRGLVSETEQQRLREGTVAIAGMGGVGGGHALTLARLGVGGFRLADADTYDVPNFNRQAGATMSTLGANKAATIARLVKDINPEARVEVLEQAIDAHNVAGFLKGAQLYLDGVDAFALAARRLLFAEARRRGQWAITAGPLGFGSGLVAFDPKGLSFEDYCGFREGMSRLEEFCAFIVAVAPAGLHLPYLDTSLVDGTSGRAPSSIMGCTLASSLIATEAMRVLIGREPPRAAPCYMQFDAYRGILRTGRLWLGPRGPIQALKRHLVAKKLAGMFDRVS